VIPCAAPLWPLPATLAKQMLYFEQERAGLALIHIPLLNQEINHNILTAVPVLHSSQVDCFVLQAVSSRFSLRSDCRLV